MKHVKRPPTVFVRFSSVFVGFRRVCPCRSAPLAPVAGWSFMGAPSCRAARLCLYHWQAEDNVGTFSLIQKCITWVLRNIGNTYVVDDLWWALVAHLLNLFFFPPPPHISILTWLPLPLPLWLQCWSRDELWQIAVISLVHDRLSVILLASFSTASTLKDEGGRGRDSSI